jgi:NADPH:quinone reductase-like Zn-dependent oxidoreductase
MERSIPALRVLFEGTRADHSLTQATYSSQEISMQAIRLHAFGAADQLVLQDVPAPVAGPRELLVRVVAAGVNPVDWKIRSGELAGIFGVKAPLTPGWDAAGIVAAVGSEVDAFKPGDAVFFFADFAHGGTYAEFVAVDAAQVALKPRMVSFAEAAALPTPVQAAWRAVIEIAQVQPGQKVLVHGGGGPLGSAAAQLARHAGARVSVTAGDASLAIARATGADQVIAYQRQDFAALVRDADLVIDTVGGAVQEASWSVLKQGGLLLATTMPPSPERAAAAGVRAQMLQTPPRGDVLAKIAELVDAGRLRVAVSHEFALADAALAHRLGESGQARGKIVLHAGLPIA